jgi:hypothetical protein
MKTPRTDANEILTCKEGDPCIAPGFARQLETELAAMTDLADRLAEAISQSPYDEPLAEALAAYENHKTKTP